VPINPYNFRDKKYGEMKVAFAGPAANFLLAVFFGLILRFIPGSIILSNQGLGIALSYIVAVNIWLAVFNLIPVPPLDGSWILFAFFPESWQTAKLILRQYGIVILVLLILFGGSFWYLITSLLFYLITGRMLTM
jgi:Zn-dependent protease